MIGYVLFRREKVEGFARKTDTEYEWVPLPQPPADTPSKSRFELSSVNSAIPPQS